MTVDEAAASFSAAKWKGMHPKDIIEEDCVRDCGLRHFSRTAFSQGPHRREKRIGNWFDSCKNQ
jgi:hypothetical protein